jgi:release factor glutamine methyltransferase
MKINEWLSYSEKKLTSAGIGTARLDTLVLLEDTFDMDRSYLLAHQDKEIDSFKLRTLNVKLKARSSHKPLAYVRGFSEFYGRKFIVNPSVLEPRSESEDIIDFVKDLALQPNMQIVDIGTGSGALAITTKLESPSSEVSAIDIDPRCLKTAMQNAKLHTTDITFMRGDLIIPISKKRLKPSVIMANLPYVPNKFYVNKAALKEPKIAIYGGSDGLDVYRRLCELLSLQKDWPKYILTESLPFQHTKLIDIFSEIKFKLENTRGFVQLYKKVK